MAANDRQIRANRANAARSAGPRTKAGKAATRLNALRHGLAAASHYEPGPDQEVRALAHAIVGAERGSDLLALARRVADAELSLRRVRSAQMNTARPPENFGADSSRVVHGAPRNAVSRLRNLSKNFEAGVLDCYEMGARSRRKFAIRDYDAAREAFAARDQGNYNNITT